MAPPPEIEDPDSPDFTGPSKRWPPKPREVTNLIQLPFSGNPEGIPEDIRSKQRQVALSDSRLKTELGNRFSYVSVCKTSSGKVPSNSPEIKTRVTFFSHANNKPVQVEMEGLKVVSLKLRPTGYSPPIGRDEKQKAIDIARNDTRLKDKVGTLTIDVIRYAPGSDRFGGHRVILVTFSKGDDPNPLYTALVDLTDEVVQSVNGPIVVRPEIGRDES